MGYKDHISKFDYVTASRQWIARYKYMLRGKLKYMPTTWFRGKNTNFLPNKNDLYEVGGLEEFIFKGWLPDEPFIDKDTRIVAIGSCFAAEISKYLIENNFTGILSKKSSGELFKFPEGFGEGVNNTFAVRQLFEWA